MYTSWGCVHEEQCVLPHSANIVFFPVASSGVLFCVGGRGGSGDPFRSIECYSITKNSWFFGPEMNSRRRHVGVISVGGKRGLGMEKSRAQGTILTWSILLTTEQFSTPRKYIYIHLEQNNCNTFMKKNFYQHERCHFPSSQFVVILT